MSDGRDDGSTWMLRRCSDRRCVLGHNAVGTNGGCQHIKVRGPEAVRLIQIWAKRIAELEAERARFTDGTTERADVVFSRGYRKGREEAEEDYPAQVAHDVDVITKRLRKLEAVAEAMREAVAAQAKAHDTKDLIHVLTTAVTKGAEALDVLDASEKP